MKKTLNVNLNGSVFTIDEDAYNLLDNYLNSLRICFRKEEGASEIITDFEARIEELFRERNRLGHQVITLEHVEDVIARVGKPADFASSEDQEEEMQNAENESPKGKKRFYRDTDNKLLGGVCSGIAAYFGWNVVAVRFIFILAPIAVSGTTVFPLPFLSSNFAPLFFLAYIALWAIAPAAQTVEQKLQMQGKPVTPDNIGKAVAAESTPVTKNEQKGCIAGFVDMFVTLLKIGVAGLGCLIGLPLLFALFIVFIVLFAVLFGVGGGLIGVGAGLTGILPPFLSVNHPMLAAITGILMLSIPVFVLIYSIIAYFAKLKPMSQSIKWVLLISWLLAFILFFFSGFRISKTEWTNNKIWWPNAIVGNGIQTQKWIELDSTFTFLEIDNIVLSNIQIEQIPNHILPSIEIIGDENLVEQVQHSLYDGRLTISALNKFSSKNDLTIYLKTSDLKCVKADFVGSMQMSSAFAGDEMEVILKGIGNFHADSLYINSLTVRTEGIGSANIAGKSENSRFETAGVGKIDALALLSDTIYAKVEGVGSIDCNPVEYLEGSTHGIGSITYKEEPVKKNVGMYGVGRIKKR